MTAERGACFGESAGWERAFWFLPEEAAARGETPAYRYGWKRQNWFAYAAAEHRAVRTGVGLFDLSPFGKIRVEGPDAEDVLQRVCANDVAVAPVVPVAGATATHREFIPYVCFKWWATHDASFPPLTGTTRSK